MLARLVSQAVQAGGDIAGTDAQHLADLTVVAVIQIEQQQGPVQRRQATDQALQLLHAKIVVQGVASQWFIAGIGVAVMTSADALAA